MSPYDQRLFGEINRPLGDIELRFLARLVAITEKLWAALKILRTKPLSLESVKANLYCNQAHKINLYFKSWKPPIVIT